MMPRPIRKKEGHRLGMTCSLGWSEFIGRCWSADCGEMKWGLKPANRFHVCLSAVRSEMPFITLLSLSIKGARLFFSLNRKLREATTAIQLADLTKNAFSSPSPPPSSAGSGADDRSKRKLASMLRKGKGNTGRRAD